jgi:hypothetical protein
MSPYDYVLRSLDGVTAAYFRHLSYRLNLLTPAFGQDQVSRSSISLCQGKQCPHLSYRVIICLFSSLSALMFVGRNVMVGDVPEFGQCHATRPRSAVFITFPP